MRNKILSFVLIILLVQIMFAPILALAEDIPVVDTEVANELIIDDSAVVLEEIIVTEQDNQNIIEEINQPEPMVAVADPAPLVEAVPVSPYQLPHNPLCAGITGDLNGDGLINEFDEEVIKRIIAGKEDFSPCGDINSDGYIGPDDLVRLQITYIVDMPRNGIVLQPIDLNANYRNSLSASGSCTIGDANGDNKIDYKDEGLVKQMIVGIIPPTVGADLDGDGYIGPGDIAKLQIAILFTHADSADVTPEEKGNCDLPTAKILYSLDGGASYTSAIKVKNGDTLTIKVVFSTPLNQFEVAYLNVDNGLVSDGFMTRINESEYTYNLAINRADNLTANVSIKKENGYFSDEIALTSGTAFTIENKQINDNFESNMGGGSYPDCETVTYSEWSACVDGKCARKVISKTPYDCELTPTQNQDLEKNCTIEIQTVEAQILGTTTYADGTLLRAINQAKIYVLENGFKRHIKTLKELAAKYFGQTIYNVSPEILDLYPTIQ